MRKRLSEACKTRLFSPLPRNKSAPFSHALGCLSAGNPLPTVRAVFDAVRGGRKERAAHGTFLSVLGLIEFRIEQLNSRQYQSEYRSGQRFRQKLKLLFSVPCGKSSFFRLQAFALVVGVVVRVAVFRLAG